MKLDDTRDRAKAGGMTPESEAFIGTQVDNDLDPVDALESVVGAARA